MEIIESQSSASLSLFLLVFFSVCAVGASLNPAPDNSRVNPNGHGNNYNPGSYNNNPSNSYGHGIDPNQIFGNPNRQPQANQPWNNLPIFPPNPTSGHGKSPQQPIYPAPQNYPQYPQNPQNNQPGNGANPFQMPFAFGAPPPGSQQNLYPERPPTRQPSLLDQFLYNKQGGRRNSGSTFDNSWRHTSFIVILSISNILVGFILTARY